MTDESENLSPDLLIYLSFFTVIMAWTFTGINIGLNSLLLVNLSFNDWFLISSLFVSTFPIPIIGISWYAKLYKVSPQMDWKFVTRDVSFEEYRRMTKEYNSAYSHIMSNVRPLRIIICIFLGFLTMGLPYSLNQLLFTPLVFSAPVFGLFLLVYGVGLVATIFPAVPGNLSQEFPFQATKKYQNGLRYLSQIPGIYWAGIRLNVGEWAGYYTLRNPILSARIEGIESVVSLNCELDTKGNITEISFKNESDHQSFPVKEPIQNPSLDEIKESMKEIIRWYMVLSEDEELLQEVLDDLSM